MFESVYFTDKLLSNLNDLVERHWDINDSLQDDSLSPSLQEDVAMKKLHSGYTVCLDNRIQLPCLWKSGTSDIISNFDYARKRLLSLLKSKILRDEKILSAYSDVFQQWENDQIIQRVFVQDPRQDGYYWAHFPVCRPGRETTKVRPVFDGAAKHDGKCINDYIMKGPLLMNDLSQVLLRFRRFQYALQADISQMFLQVLLHPSDRKFHRFLWWENNHLIIYEFLRHLFGNTGSPAVAIFCIKHTASLYSTTYPSANETVQRASIVDDMLDSRPSLREAQTLASELFHLFPFCGMKIAKFFSNDFRVLRDVPIDRHLPLASSMQLIHTHTEVCLLYTSPSPRDRG